MAPDTNNGKGIKLPFKLSELLQGASSIVSVVVVLIGLVVWSARQEGRIGELEHRVQVDNERLADLDKRGTREMAERVSVVNEHIKTLEGGFNELLKRVDQINTSGSQAGLVLVERLANDERQAVLTRERVQALDSRNTTIVNQLSDMNLTTQKLSGRLDVLETEVNHLRNSHRSSNRRSSNDAFKPLNANPNP